MGEPNQTAASNSKQETEPDPAAEVFPANYDDAEDVVLSSDEGPVPTGSLSEDERSRLANMCDARNSSDDPPQTETQPTVQAPASLAGRMLAVVRMPELALARAYRKNPLRCLLRDRFEWFKEREENRNIGREIEAAYGGAVSSRIRLQQFIRNNVLVTVAVCAALLFLLRLGVDLALNEGGVSAPVNAAVKPVAVKPAVKPGPKPKASADNAPDPRPSIEAALQHCSTDPEIGSALLANLGSQPRFAAPALNDAMYELRRFQARYQDSGLAAWYRNAAAKGQVLAAVLKAALPPLQGFVERLDATMRNTQAQLADSEQRLKTLTGSGPLNDTERINESIQLRNRIGVLQQWINDGPSDKDVRGLEQRIAAAERVLTAGDTTDDAVGNREAPWVYRARSMDSGALRDYAASLEQALHSVTDDTSVTAKLTAFRVHNAGDLLRELTDVLAFYKSKPVAMIRKVERHQKLANQHLEKLLGEHLAGRSSVAVVNYRACLEPTPVAAVTR